jgi:hypothetical protein
MTGHTGKARAALRRVATAAREFVTGVGNDGLTRDERKAYADAYRRTVRPLSHVEGAAMREWIEERRESAARGAHHTRMA